MKIFDLHADIGSDILCQLNKGKTEILKNEHLDKLAKGEVKGVAVASYFEGHESWATMQAMISSTRKEIEANDVNFIRKASDLDIRKACNMMMSVEGMCGIDQDFSDRIQWMFDQGVRLGAFCWNDENALATGVKGTVTRGLSLEGKKAVKQMNRLKMIIDVSHNNEKTFWDIIETSDLPIIASHSNARKLCQVDRNLTDQQIKAIGAKGGLIGINAARNFVDPLEENRDVHHLAKHARYMADLIGVEHLALGFDFMDFMEGADSKPSPMAQGLEDASKAQNFIEALKLENFSDQEIAAIAYENAENFLRKYLPK